MLRRLLNLKNLPTVTPKFNTYCNYFYSKKITEATDIDDKLSIYYNASSDEALKTSKDAINKAYFLLSLERPDLFEDAYNCLLVAQQLDPNKEYEKYIKGGINQIDKGHVTELFALK